MKFNIETLLREHLVGKIFIDSDFSSKGNYEYYKGMGVDYPPFDEVIVNVQVVHNCEDALIRLWFDGGKYYELYTNDTIHLGD